MYNIESTKKHTNSINNSSSPSQTDVRSKRVRTLMRQHRIKKEIDILPSSLSLEYEPTTSTYLQIPRSSHGGRIEKQSSEPPLPTQFSIDDPPPSARLSPVRHQTSSPQFLMVPGSNIPPPGPLQKQRSQPLLPSQMSITQQAAYSPISTAPVQRQMSQPPIHIAHSPPVLSAQPAFQISQGSGKPPVQVHYLQASPSTPESRRLTGSPSIVIEQYPPSTTSSPTPSTTRVMRIDQPMRILSAESVSIKVEPGSSSPSHIVDTPKSRLTPLRPKDDSKTSSPQTSLESPGSDSSQRLVHCPVLRPGPALGCNFCWNTVDAHGRILRRKTKYCCPECQTNLCIVPCFQQYHLRFDGGGGSNKKNNNSSATTQSTATTASSTSV